jgi:hypothetical protein
MFTNGDYTRRCDGAACDGATYDGATYDYGTTYDYAANGGECYLGPMVTCDCWVG